MTKLPYWAKSTPVRSRSRGARSVLICLSTIAAFGAISFGQDAPAPAKPAAESALSLLHAGITAQAQKQPAVAVRNLRSLRERVPALADYVGYSLAAAEYDLGDFNATLTDLEPVWKSVPPSPLTGEAAILAARANRDLGKPVESVRILRQYYTQLAQPAGDALLAACYKASSDLASSAVYYQRVYYQFPLNGEAEQAGAALADLRAGMGQLYPPPTTESMFQRADKLAQAGEYRRARAEYDAMISSAAGADREIARVRIGVLEYLAYQTGAAYDYLRSLEVSSPEADSERLYYILECARRQDRDDVILDAIKRLERYPQSPWRLKALYSAGNRFLLTNRTDVYVPQYRACYESFPDRPQADYCHWKVTWNAYLTRKPEAVELLRDQLAKFPGSERASAALYFLGRLAEKTGALDAAKGYYSEILDRFPNHYYADLADERLADPALFRTVESAQVREFLNGVVWPVPRITRKFDPTPATSARIERARLLDTAGLEELSEAELRYGARTEDQPHVLATHLARLASKYDSPHRALRLIKSLVPNYLSIPLEDAPAAFWRLLYPMPWRTDLERNAKLRGLDPYIVAGLIRQESEFNPQALSAAQAYGLTQLLPSTGRSLMKVSRRKFRATVLFRPDVNLRLGTTYLRSVYDNYSGKWEQTLAAYNAGGSRVQNWMAWGDYREPAEFVETIPFTETRGYVFAVLRNASIYRKLYSPESSGLLAADRFSPAVRTPAAANGSSHLAAKRHSFKRNPVVVTKKHRATRRHTTRRAATSRARTTKKPVAKD